jgi:hypothetical protein
MLYCTARNYRTSEESCYQMVGRARLRVPAVFTFQTTRRPGRTGRASCGIQSQFVRTRFRFQHWRLRQVRHDARGLPGQGATRVYQPQAGKMRGAPYQRRMKRAAILTTLCLALAGCADGDDTLSDCLATSEQTILLSRSLSLALARLIGECKGTAPAHAFSVAERTAAN